MAIMEEIKSEFTDFNEIKVEKEEYGVYEKKDFERNFKEENVIFKVEPFFLEDVAIKFENKQTFSFQRDVFHDSRLLTEQKSKLEEAKQKAPEKYFVSDESYGEFGEYRSNFDNEANLTNAYAKKSYSICAHRLTEYDAASVQDSYSVCIDTNLRRLQCLDSINENDYEVTNVKSVPKETGLRRFNCKMCSYSCIQKSNLTFHIRAVHKKEKPFKCSECGRSCSKKSSLRKHIQIVHEKLKPHKCSLCNFCSGIKSGVENHIQSVHHKLKRFKCSECKYTTCWKACLYKHIKAVHQKLRPFKCKDCDYSSFQKGNLMVHMSKIHVSKKTLQCKKGEGTCFENCSSETQEPQAVIKFKPLKWNDRGFTKVARDNFEADAQSVLYSKFNSFKCSECDYACFVKGSLSLHSKVAHPNWTLV